MIWKLFLGLYFLGSSPSFGAFPRLGGCSYWISYAVSGSAERGARDRIRRFYQVLERDQAVEVEAAFEDIPELATSIHPLRFKLRFEAPRGSDIFEVFVSGDSLDTSRSQHLFELLVGGLNKRNTIGSPLTVRKNALSGWGEDLWSAERIEAHYYAFGRDNVVSAGASRQPVLKLLFPHSSHSSDTARQLVEVLVRDFGLKIGP